MKVRVRARVRVRVGVRVEKINLRSPETLDHKTLFVFVVHTMNAMSGAMQLSRW